MSLKPNFDDCLINGMRSTARERWVAFYRLYRLAFKSDNSHNLLGGAVDCLRLLGWGYHIAVICETDPLDVCRMFQHAKMFFLWKSHLRSMRWRRLHGGFVDGEERAKLCARRVTDETGMEVTPDQAAQCRLDIVRKFRDKAMRSGIPVPKGDEALLKYLARFIGREDVR